MKHQGIAGNTGTRRLGDNLSDLRAQIAANQKGITLVGDLIARYTLPVVQAYMSHIQVWDYSATFFAYIFTEKR